MRGQDRKRVDNKWREDRGDGAAGFYTRVLKEGEPTEEHRRGSLLLSFYWHTGNKSVIIEWSGAGGLWVLEEICLQVSRITIVYLNLSLECG